MVTKDDTSAHIGYSRDENANTIIPHGLLSETGLDFIINQSIKFENWDDIPAFFRTGTGNLPFDIFAATFYLLSRYEEYGGFTPDHHNRFPASESVLYQNKILDKPLINLWALQLQEILKKTDTILVFKPRKFQYISTIDVDQMWKYKNKGFLRSIIGNVRDLYAKKWENFLERWPVLFGFRDDPFFNFDWQKALHLEFNTKTIYFLLLGNRSKFDKNIPHSNIAQQRAIQQLANSDNVDIGIHPSYHSNLSNELVSKEIKRLKDVTGDDVTISRQHFLMHQMPTTFHNLIANGITEEHTLGYSTDLGFRAGIACPFQFYDIGKEKITNLTLYPFCVMDITAPHYYGLKPDQAIARINDLMTSVYNVGGLFISLWHNESLSETERWKGWRVVYKKMVEKAAELSSK